MFKNRLALASLFIFASLATPAAAIGFNGFHVGGTADINEPVDGNLYVAGGHVTVTAPVSGKARIAGGHVEIGSGGSVSRDAAVAGGDVVIKGRIEGNLSAAGGNVTLDGPVEGNATVAAGTLTLGPNARISGKLRYRAEDFERDPAAQVSGGVVRTSRTHRGWDGSWESGWEGRHAGSIAARVVWTLGLMVLAAAIAGALPGATRRMEEELRAGPWLAPLMGFAAVVCIPVAAILVMITIVGIPIGLLALMGYGALLLVGYVCASVVLGGLVLERVKAESASLTAWRVGAAVVAMLVISLAARIPFVGGTIAFAALIVGVGVIVAAVVHRARPPQAAAAT